MKNLLFSLCKLWGEEQKSRGEGYKGTEINPIRSQTFTFNVYGTDLHMKISAALIHKNDERLTIG